MELDWLKKWNIYSPHKVAIKDGETQREFTYEEFYRISLQSALYLKEKYNIKSGDRVAVLSSNELEHLFLFFALQRLNAVLVPINFRLTEREILYIATDSAPKLLLYQADYRGVAESLRQQINFNIEQFTPSFDQDICFANQVKTYFNDLTVEQLAEKSKFEGTEDSEIMILYTSGTTGFPKGAVLTQKSVFWNSLNTTISLNLTQEDCAVIFLPFFHTGGWNVLTTPFLHRGAKLVFLKKFDAEKVLNVSEKEKATVLFGVPTTMELMARCTEFLNIDLTNIRFAIVGGEPMPIELIKKWHNKGIPIRQGYGLTEFGPNVFSLKQEDCLRKIGSIGFANFYVQTRIVDENNIDLGTDEIGELVLQGPMCMKGYWKNSKATAETIRNSWLYTGDLVRKDAEGYFYVVGRKKDMYISGAENVYPAEVEQILLKVKGISEAAVIGIPDEKWGEAGKAFLVTDGTLVSEEEVLNHCKASLAKYKIPKKFIFVDELPKGDSGKILKKNLPKD